MASDGSEFSKVIQAALAFGVPLHRTILHSGKLPCELDVGPVRRQPYHKGDVFTVKNPTVIRRIDGSRELSVWMWREVTAAGMKLTCLFGNATRWLLCRSNQNA